MLVVHVHVRVKPECIDAFKQATRENARQSIQEPGIFRFDVLQSQEEASRFVLVEIYRNAEAPARHKETHHYQVWRDTVAGMMAEPRTSARFANCYPTDHDWGQLNPI